MGRYVIFLLLYTPECGDKPEHFINLLLRLTFHPRKRGATNAIEHVLTGTFLPPQTGNKCNL